MKKLFRVAMIGAMVVGAQSMVFASGANTEKAVETVPSIEAVKIEEGAKEEVEMIQLVDSVDAVQREMTEEEKAAQFARVKEICEALNIKYDENTTLEQVFAGLTEAQFDKLVELGTIQVMEAATSTEAIEAAVLTPAAEIMDNQK